MSGKRLARKTSGKRAVREKNGENYSQNSEKNRNKNEIGKGDG